MTIREWLDKESDRIYEGWLVAKAQSSPITRPEGSEDKHVEDERR